MQILKRCWKSNFTQDTLKCLRGIAIAILCALIIAICLRPFGFRADWEASIFKILNNFLVFQKINNPPKIQLFSQYPNEYNISDEKGWIKDKDILEISQSNKSLWLGVFNEGPVTLHNVKFILFPPNEANFINRENWDYAWLIAQFGKEQKTQCEYKFQGTISPRTGWVIPVPMQLEFPKVGYYQFNYAVISDEYGPYMKSFIVKKIR